MEEKDRCCNDYSSCRNLHISFSNRNPRNGGINKPLTGLESEGQKRGPGLCSFFLCAKGLYAAALGIGIYALRQPR
jgi:hypothetical protein